MNKKPIGPKVRKVSHIRFHLGIQFMGSKIQGGPLMHLDINTHAKHNIEIFSLPNTQFLVNIDGEEFIVPDSIVHFARLKPESNDE